MYIVVDETEYRHLSGLTFAPQTDMTGDQLPVNEFEADVYTDGMLYYGQWAYLYDDLDNIWAFYYIVYAQRVSAGVLHIRARSPLELMERVTLQEQYYSGAALDDVLDDTFNALGDGYTVGIDYTIDEALEAATVTGYCPEQNARERLQWVAFAVGAYVRTYGSASVDLLPVSQQATLIPLEKHFWRPKLTYSDIVTALTVTEYEYQQVLVPQNDNATTYKFPPTLDVEEQQIKLNNPGQITGARKNEIDVDGMYLITEDNSDAVLDRMSRRYFKRTSVDLDIIDNAEYWPGQSVIVYADPDTLIQGFIESAAFAFGKQARATLHLIAADTVAGAELLIVCKWGDTVLNSRRYTFPVGYGYDLPNPYIDMVIGEHRYIFRPITARTTGTMAQGGAEVEVSYEVALDLQGGVLHVISVDEVTVETEGSGTEAVNVGVIA